MYATAHAVVSGYYQSTRPSHLKRTHPRHHL